MRFLTKTLDFCDFLEILKGLETHLSYHHNIKMVVSAPKTAGKCLTVKMKVLQKFLYQVS